MLAKNHQPKPPNPDTFNLLEESSDEQGDLVTIELKSIKINVQYSQLCKYSQLIQEEYNIISTHAQLSSLIQGYVHKYEIQEKNVIFFINFLQEKSVTINTSSYFDLYKLSTLFKVNALKKTLKRYIVNHSNDISYIVKMILDEKNLDELDLIENDNNSVKMEELLYNRVNECLQNVDFCNLPISTIFRIIEKSNEEDISSDSLYDFIKKSIMERSVLFNFLKIEKLNEKNLNDIYQSYLKDKNINVNIALIGCKVENLLLQKKSENNEKMLNKQINDLKKKLDSTNKEKNQLQKKYEVLSCKNKMLNLNVDELSAEIEKKKKEVEDYLNKKRKEDQAYIDMIKVFIFNGQDIQGIWFKGICSSGNNFTFCMFIRKH